MPKSNPSVSCNGSVDCCATQLPSTVTVTMTVPTAPATPCDCADGVTLQLTHNATTGKWEGSGSFGSCGYIIELKFYCPPGGVDAEDFLLDVDFPSGCSFHLPTTLGPEPEASCDPLDVSFYLLSSVRECGCDTYADIRFTVTV